ncbi:MAG: hypothetical protein JO297_07125 [Nitrososphaeraceae archaeon]|nr:hypothetical protein [Nitrososphaeraceae archaeon]
MNIIKKARSEGLDLLNRHDVKYVELPLNNMELQNIINQLQDTDQEFDDDF